MRKGNFVGKRAAKNALKKEVTGLLFASPWIIGFLLLSAVPIVLSACYSLSEYNIFTDPTFIGVDNYTALFRDDLFRLSAKNTLGFTLVSVPLQLILGMCLALILNLEVKGQSIFRTCYYLPSIIPLVASAVLWRWLYNSEYGLVNTILKLFGLSGPAWLQNAAYTKPAMLIMGLWGCGNIFIVFLASLKDVPREYYEAAWVDGAGAWKRFWHITVPSMSSVIFYQLVLSLIQHLQYFTQAYVMLAGYKETASGGPSNSLLFYSLRLFHQAFYYYDMGSASAMAWILFLVTLVIIFLLFKSSGKWVFYGEDS